MFWRPVLLLFVSVGGLNPTKKKTWTSTRLASVKETLGRGSKTNDAKTKETIGRKTVRKTSNSNEGESSTLLASKKFEKNLDKNLDKNLHEESNGAMVHSLEKKRDKASAEKKQSKAKSPMTPMSSLGYKNITNELDPELQNIPGPAARLGIDVRPAPIYKETEAVKHYEFESIPLDQRPPMKLSELDNHISPVYAMLGGLFLGTFALGSFGLVYYVGAQTERSFRNGLLAIVILGLVYVLILVLRRLGMFDFLWDTHVKTWGESWFEGLVCFPFLVLASFVLLDFIIRAEQSWLTNRLSFLIKLLPGNSLKSWT